MQPEEILNLPGEVVSGHPDRHVMRVTFQGRVCWLKREHRVHLRDRIRNWRDGFGLVSKSLREAVTLRQLAEEGFNVPQVIDCAEIAGRAFLLLEEFPRSIDLRQWLSEEKNPHKRRQWIYELGSEIGRLHCNGWHWEDPYARHVRICADEMRQSRFLFFDWQRARKQRLTETQKTEGLALLLATISEEWVTLRELACFLAGYRAGSGASADSHAIRQRAEHLKHRPGVREQRQLRGTVDQRLIWLDGEGCCAIPEVAGMLDSPAIRETLFTVRDFHGGLVESHHYRFSGGRWLAWLRRRNWRSPELQLARLLFLLQKHGIAAPQLLAFGQKRGWAFVWYRPLPPALPEVADSLMLLDRLHAIGIALVPVTECPIAQGGIRHIHGIRYIRKVSATRRARDRKRLLKMLKDCVEGRFAQMEMQPSTI